MATTIVFDVAAFRVAYPQFASNVAFPDVTLQAFFTTATAYISNVYYGWYCGLTLAQQTLALNLLTAHLAAISALVAAGQTPGMISQATIDKISVSLQTPPEVNQWQWWLNLTPYGMQLLALLQVASVGGTYIGGRPELAAIRKVGGLL